MGIRFFCPRGHKLNVKAELAGKIGICPKCGERMLIPLESTREPGQKRSNFANNGTPEDVHNDSLASGLLKDLQEEDIQIIQAEHAVQVENANKSEQIKDRIEAEKRSVPIYESEVSAGPVRRVEIKPIISNDVQGTLSFSGPGNDLSESQNAPDRKLFGPAMPVLDQNSDYAWHVRGADNQTYGPANSQTIKTWIKEKRIGPSTLVWHEGWSNWKEAKEVFSELVPVNAVITTPAAGISDYSASNSLDNLNSDDIELTVSENKKIAKKKKAVRDLFFVIILIVLIAVLVGVLCFILIGQKKSKNGSPDPAPAPAPAVQTNVLKSDSFICYTGSRMNFML